MSWCPICDQEHEHLEGAWCDGCSDYLNRTLSEWEPEAAIPRFSAEWAAARARASLAMQLEEAWSESEKFQREAMTAERERDALLDLRRTQLMALNERDHWRQRHAALAEKLKRVEAVLANWDADNQYVCGRDHVHELRAALKGDGE